MPGLTLRIQRQLVPLLLLGSFVITFLPAIPRMARYIPRFAENVRTPWESLRSEHHAAYRSLAPIIAEISQRVPENAVVVIENFQMLNHQFLAYYLAPRRFFTSPAKHVVRGPNVWVLSLRAEVDGRIDFQLTRALGDPVEAAK
jgi:hypothetical protein